MTIKSEKKLVKRTHREKLKERFKPKEDFVRRMEVLLGKEDAEKFFEISYTSSPDSIRCNTLKISPSELRKRLENYGWKIEQPFRGNEEVMIVSRDSGLKPGELGKTKAVSYTHLRAHET